MGRKRVSVVLASVLLAAVSAGTALYAAANVMREDHTAPEFTVDSEVLEVSVGYTQEDLLRGVTARDSRDGDVTDSIVVEQIADIGPDHTAEITYAAFDRSGNVKKTKRTLLFTDYQPPRFRQKQALVMPEGSSDDVLRFMGAEDLIDGDLSGHIKGNLISDTVSLSRPGAHQVEFRVTNSMGDTVRIVLPVDVYPATVYNAQVELTEYLVYLPRGSAFSAQDYLSSFQVGSLSYSLRGDEEDVQILINETGAETARHVMKVDMNDSVNPAVPGIYSVTYTVTMNDQYAGFTRLNVVVEE